MKTGVLVVTGTCFLLAAPAAAKDADETVAAELGKALDAAVQEAVEGPFWGAVLVSQGGKIQLAKGYGMADLKERPNTARTLFEIASASKQVAATAILHLEQKKKLSLDDTLDRFFKGLPKDKHAVTLHHLLTHTSGLSPELGVPYSSTIPTKRYVEQMLGPPLVDEPGAKFAYNNAGYALLAVVVEKASGTSFEKYVEKHLFKPAGMKDTGFINDRDLIKTGRAAARQNGEPGFSAAKWHWGWGYRGMGGVVTTVLDLHRWDRALRDDTLLDADGRERLYTVFKQGYALGWRVGLTERGTRVAEHSGSVRGFGCDVVRFLEDDAAIFVLSNEPRHAGQVRWALQRMLFAPVTFAARFDVRPYKTDPEGGYSLPADVTWDAQRSRKGGVALRLRDGKHVAAEADLQDGTARHLLEQLDRLLEAWGDAAAKTTATRARIVLPRAALKSGRAKFAAGMQTEIRAKYGNAEPGTRPELETGLWFYVKDPAQRLWPLVAELDSGAAKQLADALRDALD